MSEKVPVIRTHECANCRTPHSPQDIKMCSGCKVMGYCSKECQKADWKQHKLLCSKTHTGASALTRPPDIKVAERIFADVDIMCHIDGILIKCLDLEHHPENAEKYAVALSCRVELTDTRRAADRISYFMRGEEPPPLPERLPKLFQIGKATLIPNESVPPSLDETVERQRKTLEEAGFFQPGCKQIMVRCMWVSEQSKWATCYYPRLVTPKMIQVAAGLTRPDSDEPMTTEDLIELFDVCALADPERNKKLTIMVSTKDYR